MTGTTDRSTNLPADAVAVAQRVLARHADEQGSLLPILHAVQDELGYVPAPVVPVIAAALNLSRAEVHGVVTYYHHFRSEPAGRTVVQICRAEACQAMGAEALLAHARHHLGCETGVSSADGRFSVEPVYCLGLCALSPAMMIGDEVFARVTPVSLERIVAQVGAAGARTTSVSPNKAPAMTNADTANSNVAEN